MKNFVISLFTLVSLSAAAQTIEGTLVLKGSLKTKIIVNTIKTTCKIKIKKVRNLLKEDSFGNPAYKVEANLSLSGEDVEKKLKVDFDKDVIFNNLFSTSKGTEVRDLEYQSDEGYLLLIDDEGRIDNVSFKYNNQAITCSF